MKPQPNTTHSFHSSHAYSWHKSKPACLVPAQPTLATLAIGHAGSLCLHAQGFRPCTRVQALHNRLKHTADTQSKQSESALQVGPQEACAPARTCRPYTTGSRAAHRKCASTITLMNAEPQGKSPQWVTRGVQQQQSHPTSKLSLTPCCGEPSRR